VLDTIEFGEELKKRGFEFYSGVPCSFLKDLINYSINESEYVMASNEGDAIAIACGAYMGGKKSVVLMQNSGLANAVSPLTSLNYSFKIPLLGFVSLRGETGLGDEPQHELMGQITEKLLETMDIEWEYLSTDIKEAKEQLKRVDESISKNKTFFFVVKKNSFNKVELKNNSLDNQNLPTRLEALESINSLKNKNSILLATTGKSGRELYEIEDNPNNLYMVGSMGCVSSIALGIALSKKDKEIIAIDGDGALLMRMGSLATNGYYSPKNMLHILLDNNTHDSTGGQKTISHTIDFVQIAKSSGYKKSIKAQNLKEFKEAIESWQKEKKLTFLYLKIAKGSKKNLGRPKIKPFEVKERLMEFIK